jgi:hypothetical protein
VADTSFQLEIEDWVRREWMVSQFAEPFYRERVQLNTGGVFDFDAVNKDKSVVASISTSGAKTAGGKYAVGKMLKIRSDMLFLTMAANVKRRLVILTEEDMYDQCCRDKDKGRIPHGIEFFCVELPPDYRVKLKEAREKASREVSPKQNSKE